MAVIGLSAVWVGGFWFLLLLAVLTGALIWELVTMLGGGPKRALTMAAIGAGSLIAARILPGGLALPFLLLPAIAGIGFLERNRSIYMMFAALIVIAAFGLGVQRDDFGFIWMLWLALIVIVTDVFGYFAGRIIGGPKFWPQVSPKKTWSGTVAGWIAAIAISLFFLDIPGVNYEILGIAVALSMAAQLGDIAESAMKRKVGVKDSSNLIPGHGGVFDRFDGMLGASVFLLLIEQLVDFPPVLPVIV